MCGIVGIVNYAGGEKPSPEVLRRMRDALLHRGPDDTGEFFDNNTALGFCRLAIIDLSTGAQPLTSTDGRYTIIFNGEIYNYKELRPALEKKYKLRTQSDTEVLLYHLIEYGPAGLPALNGMFAFALWDKEKRELLLARDRFGKKPLYYTQTKGSFLFASELKSILLHPKVGSTLDKTALARYFLFEYIPAPDTPFQNIKKVPTGSYLQFSTRGPNPVVKQWWKLENLLSERSRPNSGDLGRGTGILNVKNSQVNRSQNLGRLEASDNLHQLDHLLDQAVRYRMVADVPVGVLLSGGIDSSTIAYYMRQHTDHLHSFSVSFEDESFNESPYALKAAEALGTIHHDIPFTLKEFHNTLATVQNQLDEPLADASILPTLLVSQAAKEHITVTLDGDGADELLYGYDTFPAYQIAQALGPFSTAVRALANILPTSYRNFSLDFKLKSFVRGLPYQGLVRNQVWLGSFHDQELKQLLTSDWQIPADNLYHPVNEVSERFSADTPLQQLSAASLAHYIQDGILAKLDRASMYASL
ncbi:MAG: asparagine synthase (glutamine-hydrolyzing), partial [Patescibacteria group bacterium]